MRMGSSSLTVFMELTNITRCSWCVSSCCRSSIIFAIFVIPGYRQIKQRWKGTEYDYLVKSLWVLFLKSNSSVLYFYCNCLYSNACTLPSSSKGRMVIIEREMGPALAFIPPSAWYLILFQSELIIMVLVHRIGCCSLTTTLQRPYLKSCFNQL